MYRVAVQTPLRRLVISYDTFSIQEEALYFTDEEGNPNIIIKEWDYIEFIDEALEFSNCPDDYYDSIDKNRGYCELPSSGLKQPSM